MNDQLQSLLRSILKFGGGWFVAKGMTDNSTAELVAAVLAALAGFVWSAWTHKKAEPGI